MPALSGAADKEINTSYGAAASIAALREIVAGHSELWPPCAKGPGGHFTGNFFRMQLRGEKSLPLPTFEAALDRLFRVYHDVGREMVRRVVNQLLSRYGMHAVDGEHTTANAKGLAEEQLEANLAVAQFTVAVDRANHDGPRARVKAARLGDRAIAEIRDVQDAVLREGSSV